MSEHESEADPVSVRTTTDASHDQVAAIGNTIDTNSEAVIPDVTTKVDTHEQSTAQEASSSIEHLVTNPIDAADKDNVSVKSSDVLVDTSDGNHPAPVEAHKDPETTIDEVTESHEPVTSKPDVDATVSTSAEEVPPVPPTVPITVDSDDNVPAPPVISKGAILAEIQDLIKPNDLSEHVTEDSGPINAENVATEEEKPYPTTPANHTVVPEEILPNGTSNALLQHIPLDEKETSPTVEASDEHPAEDQITEMPVVDPKLSTSAEEASGTTKTKEPSLNEAQDVTAAPAPTTEPISSANGHPPKAVPSDETFHLKDDTLVRPETETIPNSDGDDLKVEAPADHQEEISSVENPLKAVETFNGNANHEGRTEELAPKDDTVQDDPPHIVTEDTPAAIEEAEHPIAEEPQPIEPFTASEAVEELKDTYEVHHEDSIADVPVVELDTEVLHSIPQDAVVVEEEPTTDTAELNVMDSEEGTTGEPISAPPPPSQIEDNVQVRHKILSEEADGDDVAVSSVTGHTHEQHPTETSDGTLASEIEASGLTEHLLIPSTTETLIEDAPETKDLSNGIGGEKPPSIHAVEYSDDTELTAGVIATSKPLVDEPPLEATVETTPGGTDHSAATPEDASITTTDTEHESADIIAIAPEPEAAAETEPLIEAINLSEPLNHSAIILDSTPHAVETKISPATPKEDSPSPIEPSEGVDALPNIESSFVEEVVAEEDYNQILHEVPTHEPTISEEMTEGATVVTESQPDHHADAADYPVTDGEIEPVALTAAAVVATAITTEDVHIPSEVTAEPTVLEMDETEVNNNPSGSDTDNVNDAAHPTTKANEDADLPKSLGEGNHLLAEVATDEHSTELNDDKKLNNSNAPITHEVEPKFDLAAAVDVEEPIAAEIPAEVLTGDTITTVDEVDGDQEKHHVPSEQPLLPQTEIDDTQIEKSLILDTPAHILTGTSNELASAKFISTADEAAPTQIEESSSSLEHSSPDEAVEPPSADAIIIPDDAVPSADTSTSNEPDLSSNKLVESTFAVVHGDEESDGSAHVHSEPVPLPAVEALFGKEEVIAPKPEDAADGSNSINEHAASDATSEYEASSVIIDTPSFDPKTLHTAAESDVEINDLGIPSLSHDPASTIAADLPQSSVEISALESVEEVHTDPHVDEHSSKVADAESSEQDDHLKLVAEIGAGAAAVTSLAYGVGKQLDHASHDDSTATSSKSAIHASMTASIAPSREVGLGLEGTEATSITAPLDHPAPAIPNVDAQSLDDKPVSHSQDSFQVQQLPAASNQETTVKSDVQPNSYDNISRESTDSAGANVAVPRMFMGMPTSSHYLVFFRKLFPFWRTSSGPKAIVAPPAPTPLEEAAATILRTAKPEEKKSWCIVM